MTGVPGRARIDGRGLASAKRRTRTHLPLRELVRRVALDLEHHAQRERDHRGRKPVNLAAHRRRRLGEREHALECKVACRVLERGRARDVHERVDERLDVPLQKLGLGLGELDEDFDAVASLLLRA